MVRKHYLVSGKVQGVGFRNFVHTEAQALKLSGAVRNLDDGRVEIIAAGAENTIIDFEKTIARGPIHSRVTSVDGKIASGEALEQLAKARGFKVESDGENPWA